MKAVLVINAVGLTEELMQRAMPKLRAWSATQSQAYLRPDLPAVTCTVQASMLTGVQPGRQQVENHQAAADNKQAAGGEGHGAVANGWYFRDLAEVWLWRQSVGLLQAPTLFEQWRKRYPQQKSAQIFWWWNLPSHADLSLTPRPTYWADGRKGPDIHSNPPQLRQRLNERIGEFPLFQFWGPGAGIASSRWIVGATLDVLQEDKPGLTLVYLPHLDYDLQRFGPNGAEATRAAAQLDGEIARLLDYAAQHDIDVIVLSEYGIEEVSQAVEPNMALRKAGLLQVHPAKNGALLDPGNSTAFAVCDHQCAHVYINDATRVQEVASLMKSLPGVDQVYRGADLAAIGLDHERSGELFLVAKKGYWFGYRYWLDSDQEPDFARTVEIHRKPGYDPCELFFDPSKPMLKARVIGKVLAKKIGMRMSMNVIPLDTSLVRGSHGRPPSSEAEGPLWLGPEHLKPAERNWLNAHEALQGILNNERG